MHSEEAVESAQERERQAFFALRAASEDVAFEDLCVELLLHRVLATHPSKCPSNKSDPSEGSRPRSVKMNMGLKMPFRVL